jgi:hypothetical protein
VWRTACRRKTAAIGVEGVTDNSRGVAEEGMAEENALMYP